MDDLLLKRVKIPKDSFEQLYNSAISMTDIGRKFGVSKNTVLRRIKDWGLPVRSIDLQRRVKWHKKRIESINRTSEGKFLKGDSYPINYEYADKVTAIRRAKQLRGDKCEICGWKEATVDGHHKIAQRFGGKHIVDNILLVCPNHHRLIERGVYKI